MNISVILLLLRGTPHTRSITASAWTVSAILLYIAHQQTRPSLDYGPPVKSDETEKEDEQGVDHCGEDDERGLSGLRLI